MKTARAIGAWLARFRRTPPPAPQPEPEPEPEPPARIGFALGGGFARAIAHAGVLRVFERHAIPLHSIAGVSAGAIVAAAYASGASPDRIARAGRAMRFTDVARWSIDRMGLAGSDRMNSFLDRLLLCDRFEAMRIPLGIAATDLGSGKAVHFRDHGDVRLPIRASCSYPGLFQPVRHAGRLLVDGAMSAEIPSLLCRQMGATHVVAVHLPGPADVEPGNVVQVIFRCFQIMQTRTEQAWRVHSDLVVAPDVSAIEWDGFASADQALAAGEAAATAALPAIRAWLPESLPAPPNGAGALSGN